MTLRRLAAGLTALSATALVLSACTDHVAGQANPSATGTTAAPSSTAANTSDPFAGLNPCTLLDQALAGQGFPAAVPTVADSKHSCRASKPTSADSEAVDIALSLQAGRKYDENINNPGKASSGTVNNRPATEEREPLKSSGQCGINVQVKPDSTAALLVGYSTDTEKACKTAEDVAAKVEPLLPKNN